MVINPKYRTPVVIAGYVAAVVGVMLWSGRVTEVLTFDGVLLSVRDIDATLRFYRDELELESIAIIEGKGQDGRGSAPVAGVMFSDGRKLFFRKREEEPIGRARDNELPMPRESTPEVIVLRMKGGVKTLHARLLYKLGGKPARVDREHYPGSIPLRSVSEIQEMRWGKEFALRDPDGNILIFFQPGERGGMRF